MSMKCIVPNCFIYRDTKYEGVTVHKFPVNPEARENWLKALPFKIDNLSKSAVLCSLHFHPSDIKRNAYKTFIVKDAIPCIFKNWLEVKKTLVRTDGEPCWEKLMCDKEVPPGKTKQNTAAKLIRNQAKTIKVAEEIVEISEDESACGEEIDDFFVVEIQSNEEADDQLDKDEDRTEDPLERDDKIEAEAKNPTEQIEIEIVNEPITDYPYDETEMEFQSDPDEDAIIEHRAEIVRHHSDPKTLKWAMRECPEEKTLSIDSCLRRKLQILRQHMEAKDKSIRHLKAKAYRVGSKYEKLVKTLKVVPSKFVRIHDAEEL